MASVNGVPFASVNATSGTIPINNSGSFADSPVSYDSSNALVNSASELNLFIDAGIVGSYKLYNNAQGGFGFVPYDTGLKWGFYNGDPVFSSETFLDCQIINTPAQGGFFGSSLAFKTQKSLLFSTSPFDTTETILEIKPFDFNSGEGGVNIFGGSIAEPLNSSYFNVVGDDGNPPFYKYSNAVAKFQGAMVGVVFPNVPTENRDMMQGEAGMVIYNTTDNKLQVYVDDPIASRWENLN